MNIEAEKLHAAIQRRDEAKPREHRRLHQIVKALLLCRHYYPSRERAMFS
jgi:hypothetical protein